MRSPNRIQLTPEASLEACGLGFVPEIVKILFFFFFFFPFERGAELLVQGDIPFLVYFPFTLNKKEKKENGYHLFLSTEEARPLRTGRRCLKPFFFPVSLPHPSPPTFYCQLCYSPRRKMVIGTCVGHLPSVLLFS